MTWVPSVSASRISCVISGDFVDGFERFVYEQDVRIGGQSACNSHSLALSSGEFRGITVGHFLFRTDDSDESFCGFGGRESVGDYYRQFMAALKQIDVPARIDVNSQEFYDPVDLDKDGKHRSYQKEAVLLWLDNMLFADRALNRFLAPFRGKVTCPAYYFGTMDLSCLVYSGEAAPWGREDKVMQYAFDEKCYECGFWPGDPNFPKPAFYGMPYPFVRDLQGNDKFLRPDKAFFKPEKQEFFFTLEDALNYPNPEKMVIDFCRSGFDLVQELSRWKNIDWITRPLDYPEK